MWIELYEKEYDALPYEQKMNPDNVYWVWRDPENIIEMKEVPRYCVRCGNPLPKIGWGTDSLNCTHCPALYVPKEDD